MIEPITTLDELLSDPMVQMVMARDRVQPGEIRRMLECKHRLAAARRLVPLAHVIAASAGQQICA